MSRGRHPVGPALLREVLDTLRSVSPDHLTAADLATIHDVTPEHATRAARTLVTEGRAVRDGLGGKHDPHRYTATAEEPA